MTESKLETIKVRQRMRRGGKPSQGLDYTWTEWQVVSGRTVVSRHDLQKFAEEAAESLRSSRELRAGAIATR